MDAVAVSGWGGSDETEGLRSSPSISQYSLDSEGAGGQSDHCFPVEEEFSTSVEVTGHLNFLFYQFFCLFLHQNICTEVIS